MGEEIQFTDGKRVENFDTDVVEFYAERGGEQMRFRITREALDALTAEPVPTGDLIDRFDDMKVKIWEIARRKADAVGGGHSGFILIREEDV